MSRRVYKRAGVTILGPFAIGIVIMGLMELRG